MSPSRLNVVLDEDPNQVYKETLVLQHKLPWTSKFNPRQHVFADAVYQIHNDFFLQK